MSVDITGFNLRRRQAEMAAAATTPATPRTAAQHAVMAGPAPVAAPAKDAAPEPALSLSGHWNRRRAELERDLGIALPRKKADAAAALIAAGHTIATEETPE